MKKFLIGAVAASALLASSCSTPKNITYFPELSTGSIVKPEQNIDIKAKPEDKLSIVVSTQDPALSSLFNLVTTQNNLNSNSQTHTIGTVNNNSSNGQVSYYTIDPEGDINFPVVGKIHIAGLSRSQIAEKITDELTSRSLVKDPIVTVEFANTHVAVLGEVKSPGLYTFNRDHLTILDAIASAGDLTMNGVRDNILVMRDLGNGQKEAYRVSLLDMQQLASAPVYYLQQDDVIYVEPNDKAKRETTPNGNTPYTPAFWISMGSFATTIATLIITISK